MKKYKAIVTSVMVALFITGCSANENEGANENLGLNRTNQDRDLSQTGYNPTTVNDRTDTKTNNNNNNNDNNNNNNTGQGNNQMRVTENIADRVEELKQVKRARVIVIDNDAYVGAVLRKGEDSITTEVKNKIEGAVRNSDTSIHDVHVSTNPDFVKRMDQYVKDVKSGKPVEGFTDEFQNLVHRVFPS
ncbi:YhcN/YlaJ family sporulation lipoprotein [Peribacillus sp. NPDC097264]|uniref:YhcN/YlaJ family sporulation lipoprotein n=1 Tax=Peribacillus sp. NPDC097264 TaxID=3390616 RepID=UPI003D017F2A